MSKKARKPLTALEKFNAFQKIGTEVEVPHHAWTTFMESYRPISIVGNNICLGEDYKTIEQAREALDWYVNQLGGKVTWDE